jgi:hypothetical protein
MILILIIPNLINHTHPPKGMVHQKSCQGFIRSALVVRAESAKMSRRPPRPASNDSPPRTRESTRDVSRASSMRAPSSLRAHIIGGDKPNEAWQHLQDDNATVAGSVTRRNSENATKANTTGDDPMRISNMDMMDEFPGETGGFYDPSRSDGARGRQLSYERLPGVMDEYESCTRGPMSSAIKDDAQQHTMRLHASTTSATALASNNAESGKKRVPLAYMQLAKGNPQVAAARMASTARWRQDEGINSWFQQPTPPRLQELRAAVCSGFCGWAAGREAAVWWHFPGAPHSQLERLWASGLVSPRELLKHHLFLLEYALRALPPPLPSPPLLPVEAGDSKKGGKRGDKKAGSGRSSAPAPTAKHAVLPLAGASGLLPEERHVLAVVDLGGLGLADILGPGLDFLQALATTLGDHYPGCNGGLVLVNAPHFWSLAAALVLPLLGDQVIAQRLLVFGDGWRSDPAFLALLDLPSFEGAGDGSGGVPASPADVRQSAEEAHFAAWLCTRLSNEDTGSLDMGEGIGVDGPETFRVDDGDDDFYKSLGGAKGVGGRTGALESLLEVRVGPAGDWAPRLVRVAAEKKELQLAPPGAEDEDDCDWALDDTASVASRDTAGGRAASRFAGAGSERFAVADLSAVGAGGAGDGDRASVFSFFFEGDMYEFSCGSAVEVQVWVAALQHLQGTVDELTATVASNELANVRSSRGGEDGEDGDDNADEDGEADGDEEGENLETLLAAAAVPALAYPLAVVHDVKLELAPTPTELANAVERALKTSGGGPGGGGPGGGSSSIGVAPGRQPASAPLGRSLARDRDRSGSSPRSVSAASTTASGSTASSGSDTGSLNGSSATSGTRGTHGARSSSSGNAGEGQRGSGSFSRDAGVSQSMPRPSLTGSGERPSVSLPAPDATRTSPRALQGTGRPMLRGSSPRALSTSGNQADGEVSNKAGGNGNNASGPGQGSGNTDGSGHTDVNSSSSSSNTATEAEAAAVAYAAANPDGSGWPIVLGGASFVVRRRLRSDARLEVSNVVTGSAAAKCGLQVGDVVVQAAGLAGEAERVLREYAAAAQAHLDELAALAKDGGSGAGSGPVSGGGSSGGPGFFGADGKSPAVSPKAPGSATDSASFTSKAPLGSKRSPPPQPRARGGSASRDSVHTTPSGDARSNSVNVRGATEPRPDTSFRSRSRDVVGPGAGDASNSGSGARGGSSRARGAAASRGSGSAGPPPPTPLPPLALRMWRLSGAAAAASDDKVAAAHGAAASAFASEAGGPGGSAWASAAPVRCRGTDVCVSIDAETRGMHVQQANDDGPIVIVGATGDAALRGMRRGDVLVGVHHIPLPPHATLQHVQALMESLPRPLSLNLYRASPFDRPAPAEEELPETFPLPLQAKLWTVSADGNSEDADDDDDENFRGYPLLVTSSALVSSKGRVAGAGGSFFVQIARAHKGYMLMELHHKEDPDSARLEALVL